jgi:hypothetical protein
MWETQVIFSQKIFARININGEITPSSKQNTFLVRENDRFVAFGKLLTKPIKVAILLVNDMVRTPRMSAPCCALLLFHPE